MTLDSAVQATGRVAGTVPFSAVDGTGSRYVIFLQGCGFDCLTCHNPATIPLQPKGMELVSVRSVIAPVIEAASFLTGVTITGGEPTVQPDFLEALLVALAEHPATAHLTRFVDSNGDASAEVWERLIPLVDGVMLDVKVLDPERHVVLTGMGNRRVLEAATRLAAKGVLIEVRLMLVPGINDADDDLTRTAHWLLSLDPEIRLRVNAYRRHGTRACARHLLEVTNADRARYHEVLTAAGVRNLTIG
ncbi:MAG: radical SAM protein [Kineosporiaceae bacterium]|nr:radical SAM protein [Kineosporiaceae bacterium]MBK7621258.1 radical SAM protein [Kineosporiaceae bacterium]MBK8078278.1 radical SAM protein [Kineosporiaceae bacterium]